MNAIRMTVEYLRMHARRAGRAAFRSEAGALTLEWIVIGAALVVLVGVAAGYFTNALKAENAKLP
jgi:hypothetical protein